jgi:diaminopimelate decarboxylase
MKIHISLRIKKHLESKHRQKLKAALKREKSGKQLTLVETQTLLITQQKQALSAVHHYVQAPCFDAIPLTKGDNYTGKSFRKWIPSAKSMPSRFCLRENMWKRFMVYTLN